MSPVYTVSEDNLTPVQNTVGNNTKGLTGGVSRNLFGQVRNFPGILTDFLAPARHYFGSANCFFI